jgi:hypothetical protein
MNHAIETLQLEQRILTETFDRAVSREVKSLLQQKIDDCDNAINQLTKEE